MAKGERVEVVETVSLTKVFKDFWGRAKVRAVDNLNLEIHQGEVFGLLGPNGSGKTTTIKMLLGLLFPTRGRARVFGKDPSDVEVKSRIGYLPEETRLYQFLDSWETLDFYGRLFKLDSGERDRRGKALVEMVGLSAAASRPVGQYSKGMARRIGLAQSLVNDPDFLILDEPTAGMDPIGTRQIKDLILELRKRGKTILLSSHLLADVEDVCDRVAIMYGGKLLCCGAVEELLAQDQMTELLTDRLSGEEVADLTRYLKDRFGCEVVSAGSPRDRLEPFFLRMVKQAQKELDTSGALSGGRVSDFLRADEAPTEGEAYLERLTEPVEAVSASNEDDGVVAVSEDVSGRAGRDVLDGLLDDGSEPVESPGEDRVDRIEPASADGGVDRTVLDDLMDRPEAGGDESRSDRREG